MRKIISLGLLAISLIFISSQVLAGYDQCDTEDWPKETLQLYKVYGLCNAFWDNAGDDLTQENLKQKFRERVAGTPIEDFVDDILYPVDAIPDFNCPCWTEVSWDDICNFGVEPTGITFSTNDMIWFGVAVFEDEFELDEFFSADDSSFSTDVTGANCIYDGYLNVGAPVLNDIGDAELDCLAEIEAIKNSFEPEGACY